MSLYRFDVFELDVGLYRLSRVGQPVAIGPKPFDLLHYLIQQTGRTVSRAELVREVWQAEAISDSSIPTCITAVRRALCDDPDAPRFIETVRGRGYRFIGKATSSTEIQSGADGRRFAPRSRAFVGREVEMESLAASLSLAMDGEPQTCLLLGEAGMGKTRMLEEFARRSEAMGAAVRVGRCREEKGAPAFWPWIQILRTHIESGGSQTFASLEPHAAVICQMLPELLALFPKIDPLPHVEAEQARFRLLDAITRFLQASAKQKPLALLIDDLHRADTSSLLLLEFLVRDLRGTPILILGAYRDLEVADDTTREQCLARVARSVTARSIQLRGLSRRAVGELVGHPEDAEIVSALYTQSGGNPFFLTQLVQLLEVQTATIPNRPADDWRLSLPTSVCDAIASQLRKLSARAREALTLAAVIGRDFSPALLARGLSISVSEVHERLEPPIAARLIENAEHRSGSYRFSHALLRDVVYDQIPKLDRARYHQRIGGALEALHISDLAAYIDELAFHFTESAGIGDAGKAISYCISAGEQAASRLAHENAPAHFRRALQLLDFREVADPRKRCELLIQLGTAEMRIGERETARENLLHAANIARQIDAPELLARAALGLAPGLFTIEVGTYDPELVSLLNEARSVIPTTNLDLLVQLTARLAMASVWSATAESCENLSAAALSLARDIQNPVTKAYALRARHGALWGPERFDERRRLISELGKISNASGDAEIELMYRILNITALLEIGDIASSDREIHAYNSLAKTLQLPHAEWYVSLFDAMRSLLEGRFSAAASSAQQFLELGNRVHDQNAPQSFGAHLLLRLWEDNRVDEVSDLVDQFVANHPAISAWKCVAAFFHSEQRRSSATRLFDEFFELGFENIPFDETWAIAIQMLSNTCVNIGRGSCAQGIYQLSLPGKLHHTIVGYGVMSFGSRARELGNLAGLMGRFEEAAEHFELAIIQNRKTGAAPWVARSQYDYAAMLAQKRDPMVKDQIHKLVTEAREAAQRLGMRRLSLQVAEFVKQL